jgi:hypothetical protein
MKHRLTKREKLQRFRYRRRAIQFDAITAKLKAIESAMNKQDANRYLVVEGGITITNEWGVGP